MNAVKLDCSFKVPYTDRIKNKTMNTNLYNRVRAQEINQMNEDDKSMHIFYTLEEIEDVVKSLHKVLNPADPFIGHKIAKLENIIGDLVGIQGCAETFNKKNPQTLATA